MPERNDFRHAVPNAVVKNVMPGPKAANLAFKSVDQDAEFRVIGNLFACGEQPVDVCNRLRLTPLLDGIVRDGLDIRGSLTR